MKKRESLLEHSDLLRVLSYNKRTGIFKWREQRGRANAGDMAGGTTKDGYLEIRVFGIKHTAHRLAWFYVHGVWPDEDMDHKNAVRHDNRLHNLRAVSKTVNQQNRRTASSNCKSGLIGAWRTSDGRYWRSAISVNGNLVFLGCFKTAEQAHAAYVEAKRKFHQGCTI